MTKLLSVLVLLLYIAIKGIYAQCVISPAFNNQIPSTETELKIMTFNSDWITLPGAPNWNLKIDKGVNKGKFKHGFSKIKPPPKSFAIGRSHAKKPKGPVWEPDEVAAKAHITAVAKIIVRENPDILIMQEVADCTSLQFVASEIKRLDKKLNYRAYISLGDDTFSQNIGLITKFDPQNMKHTYDKIKETRFDFQVGTDTLSIFGVHLIASIPVDTKKYTTKKEQDRQRKLINVDRFKWRKRDAAKINTLVNNCASRWILAVGDFNDRDELDPNTPVVHLDVTAYAIDLKKDPKTWKIADTVGTILGDSKFAKDSRRDTDAVEIVRKSKTKHNAMFWAPMKQRQTNIAGKAIDHMLMNDAMAKVLMPGIKFDVSDISSDRSDAAPHEHGYIKAKFILNANAELNWKENVRLVTFRRSRGIFKSTKKQVFWKFYEKKVKELSKETKEFERQIKETKKQIGEHPITVQKWHQNRKAMQRMVFEWLDNEKNKLQQMLNTEFPSEVKQFDEADIVVKGVNPEDPMQFIRAAKYLGLWDRAWKRQTLKTANKYEKHLKEKAQVIYDTLKKKFKKNKLIALSFGIIDGFDDLEIISTDVPPSDMTDQIKLKQELDELGTALKELEEKLREGMEQIKPQLDALRAKQKHFSAHAKQYIDNIDEDYIQYDINGPHESDQYFKYSMVLTIVMMATILCSCCVFGALFGSVVAYWRTCK